MEIKKEFIGCKVWSPALSRYVKIEAEKGEMYLKLGIMEIYEFEKPNLVKKENVKNSKKRNNTYRDWETDRKSTRLNSSH